jgi:hypothetical protein
MGFLYSNPGENLDLVKVEYEAKKQLLGGIYSLVFSGEKGNISLDETDEAELFYKGRFVKGEAYFKSENPSGKLCEILNGDRELVELISALDLLYLKVSCHENQLSLSLSPLGGAYTYTVFPPMKYGGILPRENMDSIIKVINKIAASFKAEPDKLAAGAE